MGPQAITQYAEPPTFLERVDNMDAVWPAGTRTCWPDAATGILKLPASRPYVGPRHIHQAGQTSYLRSEADLEAAKALSRHLAEHVHACCT